MGGKARKDLAPLLGTSGNCLTRSQFRPGCNARSLGAVDVGHVEARGRCLGLGDMRGKLGFLGKVASLALLHLSVNISATCTGGLMKSGWGT